MAIFSVSCHRIKEIKFSAKSHMSTRWLTIEIDEDHEITIFAASKEAYEAMCAQFGVEVPCE